MKKLLLFILFCVFVFNFSFAQLNLPSEKSETKKEIKGQSFGSISGVIKDKDSQELLIGVTVIVNGTTKGAVTDFEGKFQIDDLTENNYSLKVFCITYKDEIIDSVKVEKNKTTFLEIDMLNQDQTLGTVNVTATKISNTELSVLSAIKTNTSIANGISSQQILKSVDKDAGEVVKRIPGITIIDDKFIIVRGLSQRYNNVWLNNNPTPSSETDVRAFSFDNIPSSMIDNIIIYKTNSPELPSDFSGGFVKIFTKNMPDKNSFSISYGTAYNEGTTFEDFYSNQGGKYDFLAFDDGNRQIPNNFPEHLKDIYLTNKTNPKQEINDLGKELNNNWTLQKRITTPDQRFSITLSRRFKIKNYHVGNITALNYGNSLDINQILNSHFSVYNFAEDKSNPAFEFHDNQYVNSTKISLLHNWCIYLKDGNKLEFRNIFNQFANDKTTVREGIDYYSFQNIKGYQFHYTQRTVYSGQLAGEHKLTDISKLDWTAGYSVANRLEPDIKRLTLIEETDETSPHYGQYFMWFNPYADPVYAGRRYMNTNEQMVSLNSNFTTSVKIKNIKIEIKTGVFSEFKTRQFSARNLGYAMSNPALFDSELRYLPIEQVFTEENLNTTTGIKIDETTNKSDSYNAQNFLNAAYFALKIPVTKKITINTGLRAEYNVLEINSFLTSSETPVQILNKIPTLFPSLNISYNLNETNLIRLAYGESINRPEFRELAPFFFVDFEQNAGMYGNPDLKNCYVKNYDLRYEVYPSANEMISIGLFYKEFTDPIEIQFLESSPLQFTFQNAEKAVSSGIEAELRKTLDFIPFMKNFSAVFNASLIKSQVVFENNITDKNRPMQGQSPYIVNAGLYYNNQTSNTSFSVLYNIIGKRIIAVGQPMQNAQEDIPELYEMSRNSLDVTFTQKIGKFTELKLGIKDIINQPIVYNQIINIETDGVNSTRNQINKQYKPGRYISLGVNVKL